MTHQAFTVISTDFENNHTFMDVVQAANSTDAFTLVALQRNGECDLVVCLEGNLCEGQGVAFPGGGTCSCSQWLDDVSQPNEADLESLGKYLEVLGYFLHQTENNRYVWIAPNGESCPFEFMTLWGAMADCVRENQVNLSNYDDQFVFNPQAALMK
ncbi:hypothetical protein ACK300_13150 [Aeromonas caviae]|uniref:hypothetical protein n=1 Tax=unclassified Aeromonas TaxID=257493 RepID=UPI0022E226E6|nr:MULTISPECIES: hypothetical protein [unclassified Aeromonas]